MNKKRIFIVEDESILALEIQIRLKTLGYEVVGSAASGEEAIQKILEHLPDLVLMDIRIKGNIDGIETAAELRKHIDIPVIFLTAYADSKTLERAKITDPFGYIIKPVEERDLHTNIEVALYKDNTQKLLREKDKWLSTVITSVGDGIIATDELGVIRFMNPMAERLTKYNSSESIGKNLSEIYKVRSESTKEPIINPYQAVLENDEVIGLATQTELIPKTGDVLQIMDSASPIKDDDGRIIGVVVVFQDMTYYRSTEELLRLQTSALNAAYNGIVITDKNGLPVWANRSIERLTGYKPEELLGKNLKILKSEKHDTSYYQSLWNTIKSGNVWQSEIINKRKDGTVYYEEMTITPIKDRLGQISNFIAIKNDVTERKINEIELNKAKDDAERSDKLKSEFLAQMSHELRTPLNIISNFMQIYEEELTDKLPQDLRDSIAAVKSQSQRIIFTIDSIINLAQLNTGIFNPKLQSLEVMKDLISPMLAQWQSQAKEKKIQFIISPEFENTFIEGDRYSISQAINNIVDNAIKFTIEGEVIINCKTMGDLVTLSVYDTGIGISEHYLPHIFEPFTQEQQGYNRKYEGNGLGMALVKQYCLVNNAEVKIDSQKGIGTIVKLSIPEIKKGG